MTPTNDQASSDCIIVFSSASRPLYRQNVLDTLAAAPGTNRVFRYRVALLGPGCDPQEWIALKASKTPALTFFSMQDESQFQDAAFIPIRLGTVVDTNSEGTFRFITVAVSRYVSFAGAEGAEPDPLNVRGLGKYLADNYGGHYPHKKYVSRAMGLLNHLGAAFLTRDADDVELFVRTAKYLNKTPTFQDASFIRMLRLTDTKSRTEVKPDLNTGVFTLEGGKEYELVIFHYRPGTMTEAVPFSIGADAAYISVIGGLTFAAASAYDRIPVRFYVSDPGSKGLTSTVISVRATNPGTVAPAMTLSVDIKPAKNFRALAATASFMLITTLLAWITTTSVAGVYKVGAIVVAPLLLVLIY